MAEAAPPARDERGPIERVLGIVTEVRPGEGGVALLLMLDVFLLLMAYYVIKPVREGLILAMPSGAEYKSYLSGVIALSLLVAVPAYGRAADRFSKDKLVVGVTLFFASHLLVFYALSKTALESRLGLAFFVWVGIFNMMLVAQFWGLAADLYSNDQGKRLFPILGLGASLGSVVGAYLTKELATVVGTYQLMLVSAGILTVSAAITRAATKRQRPQAMARRSEGAADRQADEPAAKDRPQRGTFAIVFRHRYLTLIAVFSVLFTLVNTNGEYVLGAVVSAWAKAKAAAEAAGADPRQLTQDLTTAFFGEFFVYVNVGVVVLQTFAVSRIVKYGGLRLAFFVLPFVALFDAVGIAIAPVLAVVRIGKIAENATDYSVNNTVRNMLWLPTSTEMKYKAKQAVDTFFVRAGDALSAVLVAGLAWGLGLGVRAFALVNVGLVLVWMLVARGIVRENARLSEGSRGADPG
jgi:ATP:ADP antiporter, AAA family